MRRRIRLVGGAPLPPLGVAPQGPGKADFGGFWRGSRKGPRTPQKPAWEGPEDLRPQGGVEGAPHANRDWADDAYVG